MPIIHARERINVYLCDMKHSLTKNLTLAIKLYAIVLAMCAASATTR